MNIIVFIIVIVLYFDPLCAQFVQLSNLYGFSVVYILKSTVYWVLLGYISKIYVLENLQIYYMTLSIYYSNWKIIITKFVLLVL